MLLFTDIGSWPGQLMVIDWSFVSFQRNMTEATDAYIPTSEDETMGNPVILVTGLINDVAATHALISSAISRYGGTNENYVLRSLCALVDESFLDKEPRVEDDDLYKELKAMQSLQWKSLDEVEELNDMEVHGKMEIPFTFYREGGLALQMQ
jgi:hypothetical protein